MLSWLMLQFCDQCTLKHQIIGHFLRPFVCNAKQQRAPDLQQIVEIASEAVFEQDREEFFH